MTDPLVPGCSVRHSRATYVVWGLVLLGLLVVALLWPAWWSIVLLAVGGYIAAFHPACRFANRRFGYGDPSCPAAGDHDPPIPPPNQTGATP